VNYKLNESELEHNWKLIKSELKLNLKLGTWMNVADSNSHKTGNNT
jgi:hypothetical protein